MITRYLKLVLAAAAVIVTAFSAAVPAMAAPKTHTAWEWFTLTTSSPSALPSYDVTAYGAFPGGGTFITLSSSAQETQLEAWTGGYAFWVDAEHDGTSSSSVNPRTCAVTYSQTGSYTLSGARIHGWGSYTVISHAVAPRLKDKACNAALILPGTYSAEIDAQGPVTLTP